MSQGQLDAVLRQLHDLTGTAAAELSDGQLLECFARHRDAAAFELLLRRHGPMVHGVCRRILRDAGEAEDAFQATFLVLVRRAAELNRMGSLAGWLHGVAYRVAVRARSRALRRPASDTEATEMAPARPESDATGRDLRPVLDEELARLPDKYRLPLVLCYLEGRTHEEAAAALGWPKGTVSGRLARARERLRGRLARRGLAVSASLVVAILLEQSASAVPPSLTAATTRLVLDAAGSGATAAAPGLATALADEVVAAAAGSKFRLVVAGVVAAAAVAVSAGVLVSTRSAAPVAGPGFQVGPGGELIAGPGPPMQEQANPDRFGDPMPRNAVGRLGTIRLRKGRMQDRIVFGPGGKFIASAANGGGVSLWDPGTGMGYTVRHRGDEPIASLAWSDDGKTLALASNRGSVVLRDPDLMKSNEVFRFDGPPRTVVVCSPDGKTLATAGPVAGAAVPADTVCIYDVVGRKLRLELKGHRGHVRDVAFIGDGRSVVTGGDDGSIRVWDVATGEPRQRWDVGSAVRAVAAGPANASAVAAGDAAGTIHIWDLNKGEKLRELAAHKEGVASLAWAPDGRKLASHGQDGGDVSLWELGTGLRALLSSREIEGSSIVFAPDGKMVALGGATIHLWDMATGQPLHEPNGHTGDVTALAFAPDGKVLASGGDDRTVLLWDLTSGRNLRRLDAHTRPVTALAFAPGGKTLVSGGLDAALRLWEPATGTRQQPFDQLREVPQALAFSADGTTLRWLSQGGAARLWQFPEGKELAHFPGPPNADSRSCRGTLSADGRLLAVPCPERKIRLWDLQTGKELLSVQETAEGRLRSVAISADGKRLASAADDRVTLWDAATGKVLGSPEARSQVTALTFSPDGKWLVLGTDGGMLRWCDGTNGQELAWFEGHHGPVRSLAFSPDGVMLASGSSDTTVLLWPRP